jgi:hypothetical protein
LFTGPLAPWPVLFVVLAPGIEACRYRNTIRDPAERFDFDGYAVRILPFSPGMSVPGGSQRGRLFHDHGS